MSLPATAITILKGQWAAITPDGEFLSGSLNSTPAIPPDAPLLLCHAPYSLSRLNLTPPAGVLDVLELFLFTHPATFCTPTPAGLCRALNLPIPQNAEDASQALFDCAAEMLGTLSRLPAPKKQPLIDIATVMRPAWGWSAPTITALGADPKTTTARHREALSLWHARPEWADDAPPPPPANINITPNDARSHLHDLITRRKTMGKNGTPRASQDNYTTRITRAFDIRESENEPHIITAEAGTGVGKTLGYLAPAQLWAENAGASVWISTYTRNLQRQLDTELATLYPDEEERNLKAVIRKGRENYLCLQNLSEQVSESITAKNPRTVVATALMALWANATHNGDLTGNDFPGWISGLLGPERTTMLADRRGECSYAACDFYRTCFIEHALHRARRARVIVGNHALAMINLSMAGDDNALPTRFVFDEGHHLFDAADSTFCAHLTALETADLRRWLLGPEDPATTRRARRSRGLRKRLEGLLPDDAPEMRYLEDTLHAARKLPSPDWRKHLGENTPQNALENLFCAINAQVRAYAKDPSSAWSIECETTPLIPAVINAITPAMADLAAIRKPLLHLSGYLRHRLEVEYDDLSTDMRARFDAFATSLERRADMTLSAWINMLETLREYAQNQNTPTPQKSELVDWFEITREGGNNIDIGMFRHHLDPTIPFAAALKSHAHGVIMTSATLKDGAGDTETHWLSSDLRTGASRLSPLAPERVSIPSPFDYKSQTRILIVRDIPRNDGRALAHAYQSLFLASGGGALGLFTAIGRLRAVHNQIASPLESQGIPLYAQHVDNMDTGTLIDIFREEENACLLGTDAVRDGVDVPGRSLRLLAFDRVPWPRPTILHRARKNAAQGPDYDDALTRIKLRQAYGRLIRSTKDRGIFVMLDSAFPTRLTDSFPEGVEIERVTLEDALKITREFLSDTPL